jgi:hypothetical protein
MISRKGEEVHFGSPEDVGCEVNEKFGMKMPLMSRQY